MVDYIKGTPRNQTLLFPKNLDESIEQDSHVRFIDAWINSLNMEKLSFTHAVPNETGAPPYDPKDLSKLYLYGGLHRASAM